MDFDVCVCVRVCVCVCVCAYACVLASVHEMSVNMQNVLVAGKQTYTSEAAAIGFKIFRSITHQENT